ncbi:MAG: mannose-1-phosphate guanylyltransferase/mannose-6-phosphate isomerase [Gammaproteobacteria bacterium]|nr:mannose-1-phosphate guanylyltransferase/mannose-6-phosphate isomerase [Gammaproteobacteria bacterium]
MLSIHPVVLSGGSGTRLWPLSREYFPKQLLSLAGDQTLLQQTVLRVDGMSSAVAEPLLVCNEEHRFLVAEQVRALGKTPAEIILEPIGRNTAPAATLAALSLLKRDPQALMLLMPADHVIGNTEAFREAIGHGAQLAESGLLVTFGVVPTAPETGYGYIRRGRQNRVAQFVEKPDEATARKYLASGDYLWNSGIFLMRADVWLREIEQRRPDILNACRAAYDQGKRDADFFRVDRQVFTDCPSDSIDYAVMEKTEHAAVVPLDAGWSDIGAWSALWQVSEQDGDGNVTQGDVMTHSTRNALVIAQHRLVATVGLEDVIVIETADAVLVAHKSQSQNVRDIVDRLKREKRTEHLVHRCVSRPWGSYEGIDDGARFQVKRLVVKPRASLSLQMHYHRAEHWVVVKGTARVTRGDESFVLTENQSTYIPLGTRHRLENPGNIPLEIIEVQSGSYLGEDDIVRFEDAYNRHKN